VEVEGLEAVLEGGVVGGVLDAVDALLVVAPGVDLALELEGDDGGESVDDSDEAGHAGGLVARPVLHGVHNAVGAGLASVDALDLLLVEEDLAGDLGGELAVEVVPCLGALVSVLEAGLDLLVSADKLELGGDGVADDNGAGAGYGGVAVEVFAVVDDLVAAGGCESYYIASDLNLDGLGTGGVGTGGALVVVDLGVGSLEGEGITAGDSDDGLDVVDNLVDADSAGNTASAVGDSVSAAVGANGVGGEGGGSRTCGG